jgi:hypothetical protein
LGYSKKKKTIAKPEFRLFKEIQGRFTDLLPDTGEATPDQAQTLH